MPQVRLHARSAPPALTAQQVDYRHSYCARLRSPTTSVLQVPLTHLSVQSELLLKTRILALPVQLANIAIPLLTTQITGK